MIIDRDATLAAVCTVVVAVYAWPLVDPSRDWQFILVWDDHENFITNDVYKGLSLSHLHGMFTLAIINVWEPFGWLLKALVYATVGSNARAYRLVTLVLHLGAAWVLAQTASLVLAITHGGIQLAAKIHTSATVSTIATLDDLNPKRHLCGCILAALIVFAVHPISIEVVAWPSAQPYALAFFFSALSLYFHSRRLHHTIATQLRAPSPKAARGASPESESIPSDWHHLFTLVAPPITDRETQLSAACFVAAVLSKSVCVLLPVATVLIDCLVVLPVAIAAYARSSYFPTPPQCMQYGRWYLVSKWLLVIAAVLFVSVTIVVNEEGADHHADVITLTPYERMIKALSAPAWIIRSMLWPAALRPHYRLLEDEVTLLGNPEYLLSVAALPILLVWLASRPSEFRIPSLLAFAFYCAMILPTCGLIQHGLVAKGADRYAYFPIIVLIPICGSWFSNLLDLVGPNDHLSTLVSQDGVAINVNRSVRAGNIKQSHGRNAMQARVLYGIILAMLLIIDAHQMRLWESSDALITHSLRLDPADSRILHSAYNHQVQWGGGCGNDQEQCKNWLHLAYHFAPVKSEKAKHYRYMIMFLLNRGDSACEGYKLMAVEYPESAMVENNLAICAILEKRPLDAREHIRRAQTLPFYNNHNRQIITDNYVHMMEWLNMATLSPGKQVPFNAKVVW